MVPIILSLAIVFAALVLFVILSVATTKALRFRPKQQSEDYLDGLHTYYDRKIIEQANNNP